VREGLHRSVASVHADDEVLSREVRDGTTVAVGDAHGDLEQLDPPAERGILSRHVGWKRDEQRQTDAGDGQTPTR
jgi:hypothetical protein